MATVTETWFQSDENIAGMKLDLNEGSDLSMLTRERTALAANGRKYGGVALVFRNKFCKF